MKSKALATFGRKRHMGSPHWANLAWSDLGCPVLCAPQGSPPRRLETLNAVNSATGCYGRWGGQSSVEAGPGISVEKRSYSAY